MEEVAAGDGNDVIFANPEVEEVDAGAGDDVVYGEPPEASTPPAIVYTPAPAASATASAAVGCAGRKPCYGGSGNQELIGGAGNDTIFGQRGNDTLYGNAGNDALFGGIGDEALISGGAGNDLLSGGLGADRLNGNADSDLVRGDGTIDQIEDTGAAGTDTLSFATAVTPGFRGAIPNAGFPADGDGEERGVSVRLDGLGACGHYEACNNGARYGGGNDEVLVAGFESLIGSPFADVLVGSSGPNRIDGGGGADLISGKAGDDLLYGGADGDYLQGDSGYDTVFGQGGANRCSSDIEAQKECGGIASSVAQRDRAKISAGFMATDLPPTVGWSELYLTGSSGRDDVVASFGLDAAGIGRVTFTAQAGSAPFDLSTDARTAGCSYAATQVVCSLAKPLDAVTMAGMAGNDRIAVLVSAGSWETLAPVLLGGEGDDEVLGSGSTEDLLVDGNGTGRDTLYGYGYDDALINNEGADVLRGGNGSDLFVSASNCNGDAIDGAEGPAGDGAAVNNASWAQLPAAAGGLVADLERGLAGSSYQAGPACPAGALTTLQSIDDLEGSSQNDSLYGDANSNNLLGRLGSDGLWARAGADEILAHDGLADTVGGSGGSDNCSLDRGLDAVNSCNP